MSSAGRPCRCSGGLLTGAGWIAALLVGCPGDGEKRDTGVDSAPDADSVEDSGDTASDSADSADTGDSAPRPDGDGDGWPDAEDCDPADAAVHPGAEETCGDEVDQDCDGYAPACRHEGAVAFEEAGWLALEPGERPGGVVLAGGCDVDGDGIDEVLAGIACVQTGEDVYEGPGAVYVLRGGEPVPASLGDAWATVSPAADPAAAAFGSMVACAADSNGDGRATVVLGGWLAYECGHGPTGDTEELTLAILHEVVPGTQGLDGGTGTLVLEGTGGRVSGAGRDLDGDGAGDMLVGTILGGEGNPDTGRPGINLEVFPLDLAGEHDESSATAWFKFEQGYALRSYDATGDYDGDGLADVVVGWEDYDATSAGDQDRVYVFDGPVSGPRSPADADGALEGSGDPSYTGNYNYFLVAALGDFDGDGRDDLAVANRTGGNAVVERAGSVFVLPGPLPASGSLVDAPTWLTGAVERASLGYCVAGPGDVDGDGHSDLLASAGGGWTGGTGSVAHLVHGPQSGTLLAEEVGATLVGEFHPGSCAGIGDFTADGHPDIAFGDDGGWDYSNNDHWPAGAWLLSGVPL